MGDKVHPHPHAHPHALEAAVKEHPHAIEEWKECRATVARIDKIISDLRKHSFMILGVILTAKAYLFLDKPEASGQIAARFGVSLVTMVLILAFFVVDRYHEVVLRATLRRAIQLEQGLDMTLTSSVFETAKVSGIDRWGFGLYSFFVLASFLASVLANFPFDEKTGTFHMSGSGGWVIAAVCVIALLAWISMLLYHFRTTRVLTQEHVLDVG
jgi:hypothetical protein